MILINKGEEFKIHFNSKEYNVPVGKFEVTQELGAHIISKTQMWGKDVVIENKEKMKIEQTIIPEEKKTEEKKEDKKDLKEDVKTDESFLTNKK